MSTHPILRLCSLAGLGALLVAPAFAADEPYYYGGVSLGQARNQFDMSRRAAWPLAAGASVGSFVEGTRDTEFKVFGGYQFNPYLGLELGYFSLGKAHLDAQILPDGTLSGQFRLRGGNLDLVGALPLGTGWSVLGRVGAHYTRSKIEYTGTGSALPLLANPKANHTNIKIGTGLQYQFNPSFLMRGEIERYRVEDALSNHGNVNALSVSLVFPFGRTPTPMPVAMAPAPAYVAPPPPAPAPAPYVAPPPPPPPPVVVAPAPVPKRVSFEADSLFGFDKSGLRPEGKAKLDTFASDLKGTTYSSITVEGHTDRLGTTKYNQKLSEQRAETVKQYLVTSGGIDAGKISAVGKSESMPVTKPEDCKGKTATPKLIACLQPDRRVDVEVSGTR